MAYKYAISIVVLSFQRVSEVKYIAPGESAVLRGFPYLLISLCFGWWGFPFGPIFTIGSIFNVLSGGIDITDEVVELSR